MLTEGNGIGQITTAERNQIITGDLVEMVFTVAIPAVGTGPNKLAYVQAAVASQRADYMAQLAQRLNYYGYTNG